MDLPTQLSANPLAAIPVIFGAGVLTSLTPCVYPMIPITAAIVGGTTAGERDAGERPPRWRSASSPGSRGRSSGR